MLTKPRYGDLLARTELNVRRIESQTNNEEIKDARGINLTRELVRAKDIYISLGLKGGQLILVRLVVGRL